MGFVYYKTEDRPQAREFMLWGMNAVESKSIEWISTCDALLILS